MRRGSIIILTSEQYLNNIFQESLPLAGSLTNALRTGDLPVDGKFFTPCATKCWSFRRLPFINIIRECRSYLNNTQLTIFSTSIWKVINSFSFFYFTRSQFLALLPTANLKITLSSSAADFFRQRRLCYRQTNFIQKRRDGSRLNFIYGLTNGYAILLLSCGPHSTMKLERPSINTKDYCRFFCFNYYFLLCILNHSVIKIALNDYQF